MSVKKLPKDISILLTEGVAGLGIAAYLFLFKPDRDFGEGLLMGFGCVVAILAVMVFVLRLRGGRLLGDMDEREEAISGRASRFGLLATVLGLALYAMVAYAFPPAKELSSVVLALAAAVTGSLCTGLYYLIASRRT